MKCRLILTSIAPVLLSCVCLLAAEGCKTLELASGWASGSVAADGETSEWTPVSPDWLNEDNLQVAARNDAEYLHLMVRFRANDARWARSCAMTGMTVWLNPDGRKAERTGFRFVAGPDPENLPRPAGAGGRMTGPSGGMPPGFEHGPREHDRMLVFLDREAETTAVLVPDGTSGPRAGFTCADGLCSYEFSFPLAAAQPGEFGLGLNPGAAVMVGLTAGLDKEEREAMREQMSTGQGGGPPGGMGGTGGGPPGGAGGGPPGGMGGGPRGGSPRSGMEEAPRIWFKVLTEGLEDRKE